MDFGWGAFVYWVVCVVGVFVYMWKQNPREDGTGNRDWPKIIGNALGAGTFVFWLWGVLAWSIVWGFLSIWLM